MEATRRVWALVGVGLSFGVYAALVRRPLFLVGAAGIGAWLLARQFQTLRAFTDADDALGISLVPEQRAVTAGEAVEMVVTVSLARPAPTPVSVTMPAPVSADAPPEPARTVTVDTGDTAATTTVEYAFPVVGHVEFDAPSVVFRDGDGYFRTRHERGEGPTVVVTPPQLTDVHVGKGGTKMAASYGQHRSQQTGAGLDLAQLRQYLPGDPVNRIDWNATARLDEPHVREFEVDTNHRTVLIVDHGARLDVGRDGETMHDYAREVALSLVEASATANDPLSLYTVDGHGITNYHPPATSDSQYQRLRETLYALDTGPSRDVAPTDAVQSPTSPRAVEEKFARLRDADSPMATTLAPFLGTTRTYVTGLEERSLFTAAQRALAQASDTTQLVVVTDDTDRTTVRELSRLASGQNSLLVFLLPHVLFDADELTDREAASDEYRAFEEFRRTLDGLGDVHAFEVGPGDRVETLLAARR